MTHTRISILTIKRYINDFQNLVVKSKVNEIFSSTEIAELSKEFLRTFVSVCCYSKLIVQICLTGELLALFEEDDVIDEIKMIRAKVIIFCTFSNLFFKVNEKFNFCLSSFFFLSESRTNVSMS